MNILIFGSNGRLGQALVESLQPHHFITKVTRADGDLIDAAWIASDIINRSRPDVVINASAKNGLEACRDNPFEAVQVNAAAPTIMADAAKACSALMIHFSTDYVFSGSPTGLFEDTPIQPWGVYGRTKRWGEEGVALCAENYFIFRLTSLYGKDLSGVLQPIKQVQDGAGTSSNPVKVLHQFSAPTSTHVVADAVSHVLGFSRESWEHLKGIYHIATKASGLSKVDFTQYLLCAYFGQGTNGGGWHIVEGNLPEPRPVYTELRADKFERVFRYEFPEWYKALNEMLPLLPKVEKPATL